MSKHVEKSLKKIESELDKMLKKMQRAAYKAQIRIKIHAKPIKEEDPGYERASKTQYHLKMLRHALKHKHPRTSGERLKEVMDDLEYVESHSKRAKESPKEAKSD